HRDDPCARRRAPHAARPRSSRSGPRAVQRAAPVGVRPPRRRPRTGGARRDADAASRLPGCRGRSHRHPRRDHGDHVDLEPLRGHTHPDRAAAHVRRRDKGRAMTTIAFLGDTLLGGVAQPLLDAHGHDYPLRSIQHLWADADLVVANHEGPLTRRTIPSDKLEIGRKRYWYRAAPESAETLAASGIGVVSLANNHVTDFGPEGLADTLIALDDAGIAHCGAGPDTRAARRPAVVEVGGMRVGFLSLMQRYQMYLEEQVYATAHQPGTALLRPSRLARDIGRLRERVDLCVVLVHWGRNYRPLTDYQQRVAEQIVAAGADLVVGHHPHVPHPVDTVGGVPVLYSLGNGPFGTPGRYHSGRSPYGLVARGTAEPHRGVGLEIRCNPVAN